MSLNFSLYLDSICRRYAQWWQVYTLTDVLGQSSAQRETTLPLLDLGLMVETVASQFSEGVIALDKDPKNSESKVERFTVLEGVRKFAADHVLLVGRPGSGKSTALARLLLEEAQQNSATLIPVLVELRYHKTSVLELIRSFLQSHDLSLDRSDIETLLFQGRLLLLMDGLNELPSEEARREVKAFRQTYRKTPMIFTTRDLGIGGDLNLTHKLEMQPLTPKQMQEFVRSYLPTQGDALLRQLGDLLRELGKTPLLLLMLCSVFANNQNRVPSDLGSVFRQFTQLYDCKLKEDAPVAEGSREYWAEMLQVLAWKMTQGKSATELQVAIDRNEAIQVLKAFLTDKVAYPEACARTWLKDLLNHHLIQLGTGTQIEFRHQLIQEYYAAEQLLKQLPQLNDECLKWDYLNYLKWTEPFALMLELLEDEQEAMRVVRLALDVDLMLGAKLAGKVKVEWQGRAIALIQASEILQELEAYLLGETRSEKVIPRLIELLKDEDYFVCNGAAHALGRINPEAVVASLTELLKHENSDVCQIAAHVLDGISIYGSEPFFPSSTDLFQFEEDDNSHMRLIVTYALREIGLEAAIPTFIELLECEDYDVCKVAFAVLGKINSEALVASLIGLLKRKDNNLRRRVTVRKGAALLLGKIGSESAVPVLIECLEDVNLAVCDYVAAALGKIGSEATIFQLKQCLGNWGFNTTSTIAALTAIQNRCQRYNASPATSTENPIAEETTSDSRGDTTINMHFHGHVDVATGNVEGNQNIQPPASNSDPIDP